MKYQSLAALTGLLLVESRCGPCRRVLRLLLQRPPHPRCPRDLRPPKGGEVDLAAIKQTTYDPAFWQNNAVVKRTPLEEQVMKSFEQKGAFGTMLTP